MDVSNDFESVFREMVESEICIDHSMLYVCYASFLELKQKLHDAHLVYQFGMLRSLSFSLPNLFVCLFLFQIGSVLSFRCFKLCHNTCNVTLLLGMPNRLSC